VVHHVVADPGDAEPSAALPAPLAVPAMLVESSPTTPVTPTASWPAQHRRREGVGRRDKQQIPMGVEMALAVPGTWPIWICRAAAPLSDA